MAYAPPFRTRRRRAHWSLAGRFVSPSALFGAHVYPACHAFNPSSQARNFRDTKSVTIGSPFIRRMFASHISETRAMRVVERGTVVHDCAMAKGRFSCITNARSVTAGRTAQTNRYGHYSNAVHGDDVACCRLAMFGLWRKRSTIPRPKRDPNVTLLATSSPKLPCAKNRGTAGRAFLRCRIAGERARALDDRRPRQVAHAQDESSAAVPKGASARKPANCARCQAGSAT
jgi:hypothetical protein